VARQRRRNNPPTIPSEHSRFDYSPIIDRPRLSWPNGARVAVWVIPNIEHFRFDRRSTSIEPALQEAEKRGLIVRDHERIAPTARGQNFLNDLQALFLKDGH